MIEVCRRAVGVLSTLRRRLSGGGRSSRGRISEQGAEQRRREGSEAAGEAESVDGQVLVHDSSGGGDADECGSACELGKSGARANLQTAAIEEAAEGSEDAATCAAKM